MIPSFTMTDPILVATDLTKQVNLKGSQLQILNKVSVEIQKSSSVAIIGPSGAGKTTLLSLLAGLDVPSTGSVILGGVDITALTEEQRTQFRSTKVGFVFQNFYLLENLSALENVMLPLELHNVPGAKSKAIAILTELGLNERLEHYPRQLSGGEQQRVAIARAFVVEPAILFADEPTGNLDQETGEKIIDSIFKLNRDSQTTLVVITHEETLAQRCDRILRISKGGLN